MNIREMKQVVNLLYNEWDLGKTASKAKGKICAWIYLFEILEESEKIILKKENNEVVGICGYSKYYSKKYLIRKKYYKVLKNILIYSPFIKYKEEIYKYNDNYNYTPKELENYFDGEITIIIVNKDYRRKNIGKQLILKIFEEAKKDNMRNLQILSDESCNFKFYENIGCKKIYKKIIENEEPCKLGSISNEIGYIFEKKL